jgi:MFS family permease
VITFLMPNLEGGKLQKTSETAKFSMQAIKSDIQLVVGYYRKHLLVMAVCLTFGGLMVVMASAVDSLEAAFSTMVLGLSEGEYGFLVSIAGAGILIGAVCNASIVKRVPLATLISIGAIGNVIGYIIYAFSHSITVAGIGFFVLAFFVSFANTGFATFYQNTIPVENMGRIGGINGFIESVLTILMTILFGAMAQYFSIRGVIVGGVLIMLILAFVLSVLIVKASKTIAKKEHSKLSL